MKQTHSSDTTPMDIDPAHLDQRAAATGGEVGSGQQALTKTPCHRTQTMLTQSRLAAMPYNPIPCCLTATSVTMIELKE
jgi:hypothetical protein